MAFEIGSVFEGLGLAKKAAELLGVLDTIDAKIDRLAASELKAGMRALQAAANSQTQQQSLLQEARANFHKAISLERNERLAAAWVCLAICHYSLGDIQNSIDALHNVLTIQFQDNVEVAKVAAVKVVLGTFFPPAKRIGDGMLTNIQEREDKIAAIKQFVTDFLTAVDGGGAPSSLRPPWRSAPP